MKAVNIANFRLKAVAATLLTAVVFFTGAAAQVFAHGGEDHGDAEPATATTTAGNITRSVRLGDFEIMLKHSPLEPDTATAGRLFITKFATNEPVGDANPAVEIESANGAVTEIPVEKTDTVGSYTVKIPALPEGAYTLRTKAVAVGGKTGTATFSGVEVAHQEAAAAETGSSSWTQTALMAMLFVVALGLFGGLAYFALRVFKNKPLGEETVSA
jgi:hypothetical protein